MATVQLALPVTGIRGKLSGIVFSANKSGPYAMALSHGANPRTIAQMEQRASLAVMGSLWRTLTPAEQADWDTFALTPPEDDYNSLGDLYLLSGFGWFSRICLRRRRTGQADDLIAPVSTPTAAPTTFSMVLLESTGADADATFSYTNGEFVTEYAILQLSLAPGLGSNVQTTRYLNCWEALGVGATDTEFGLNFFLKFGPSQAGQRYFARLFRQSDSGIRSVPAELFVDVV
jgi:hypothetical protein